MLVLRHAKRDIVFVVFLHARRGIIIVIFLHAWHGLRYTWQTSLMGGVLPSCRVRPSVCMMVICSTRGGMYSGLPFSPVWYTQRCSSSSGMARLMRPCSVLPITVYSAVFRSDWHGPVCMAILRSPQRGIPGVLPFCSAWHARRSSILPRVAYVAVFHSTQCGICGGIWICLVGPTLCGMVPFCPVRPSVCGSVADSS